MKKELPFKKKVYFSLKTKIIPGYPVAELKIKLSHYEAANVINMATINNTGHA